MFILAQGALDIPLEPPGVGEERTNRRDHEVVGQRLTFPFPFVHQQPHDCGNKTINRWETSLWNLSYNLSAVNILHNLLLFPSFPSHLLLCPSGPCRRRERKENANFQGKFNVFFCFPRFCSERRGSERCEEDRENRNLGNRFPLYSLLCAVG